MSALPLPPPLPPPGGSLPVTQATGALNDNITEGIKLRGATTNNCSASTISENIDRARGSDVGLYNLVKSPSPGVTRASKSRGSSGTATCKELTTPATPVPRLAGLFAGGMPKLRNRGGVDTGASRSSSYMFSPSPTNITITRSVGRAPTPPAPLPPPRLPALRPAVLPSPISSLSLRKVPAAPQKRPTSAITPQIPPSPPISPLQIAPPYPPLLSARPPRLPIRKISPPAIPRPRSESPPLAVPAQATRSNHPPPRHPPPPPPPPSSNNSTVYPTMSPALVAARKAAGFSTISPPLAPLARPPPAPYMLSMRDWSDPSSFSLLLSERRSGSGTLKRVVVDDSRWKFKREGDLPRPRLFQRVKKAYKSGGKGSSITLDLRTLD